MEHARLILWILILFSFRPGPTFAGDESAAPFRRQKPEEKTRKVNLLPIPQVKGNQTIVQQLIQWEISRAFAQAEDSNAANHLVIEIPDPALEAKLKGKSPVLTLAVLRDAMKKPFFLSPEEGYRLLASLKLTNEIKLAKGAGNFKDRQSLLRDLTLRELGGVLDDTKLRKFPAPSDLENKLRQLGLPNTPEKLKQLFSDKGFNPKALSEREWADLLGAARVANATERGDRFATDEKLDAIRDGLARVGEFSLPWEKRPAVVPGTPPVGQKPTWKPDNFEMQPPLDGFEHERQGGEGPTARLRVPQDVTLDPNPGNPRGPLSIDIGPVGDGSLSTRQRDTLNPFRRPGGFSLQMRTGFSDTPDSRSLCQGTIVDKVERSPDNGQKQCTYVFATAAHCVRDKNGGRLDSLEIQGFGRIRSIDPQSSIDNPPADFAMISFTRPMAKGQTEACRSDIPMVPLARDQIADETPVLVEGRRMLVAKAGPLNRTLVQLNFRDPSNNGVTIEHGDSGGGIYRVRNGQLELVAVVSAKPSDEENFWGIGFGASQDSLNFANHVIDSVRSFRPHDTADISKPTHGDGLPIAIDFTMSVPASQNGSGFFSP